MLLYATIALMDVSRLATIGGMKLLSHQYCLPWLAIIVHVSFHEGDMGDYPATATHGDARKRAPELLVRP
jgi:hypothetical protein